MPIDKFKFTPISDADSKAYATRQILSFLSVNEEEHKKRAPSKKLFSLSKIPPDQIGNTEPFFKWESREIYDVDNVLLFRDQTLRLDDVNSLTVRTAATDLLRTPVWSVAAGPTDNFEDLITETRSALTNNFPNYKPVVEHGEDTPRLICYGYPRLGILVSSDAQPGKRFVVDLWEREPIPVERVEHGDDEPHEEYVNTVWSPYDLVSRATVDRFRARFRRQGSSLPGMPATPEQITPLVAAARDKVSEFTTTPELKLMGQKNSYYCAPATMAMIIYRLGFTDDQFVIAPEMKTNSGGTYPDKQADAVDNLTAFKFVGRLDSTTSFDEAKVEILAHRPFKIGTAGHSRACCGFMVERIDPVAGTTRDWLYVYDPWPRKEGKIYFESWEAGYLYDFIYVLPATSM